MNDSRPPKPKRRWYQYSLRTLFVVMTLFAIACSWNAYEMNEAAKRRAVIVKIEKVAGNVSWDSDTLTDRYSGSDPIKADFSHTQITDTGLVNLKPLPNLKELVLDSTPITDAGLVHLKDLPNLTYVDLRSTPITDAGLVHLNGLTYLERLRLSGTQITDAGPVHLKDFTNLKLLGLEGTQITDAGLVHMKGLTNLASLNLKYTKVS